MSYTIKSFEDEEMRPDETYFDQYLKNHSVHISKHKEKKD